MTSDDSHSDVLAESQPSSSSGRFNRLGEILLIVMVFFTLAGDPAPHVNEPHYLGRLKHYWNPAWCAGDVFLESPEAHLVFAWTFGWLTRWLTLAAVAWTGRIVVWTLLAWAWQRLSWRLVPVPLAAVLGAALCVTLMQLGNLAGEWVVGGVEAKCFAYVFVLLALGELVDRRWNRVWLWLGAASALHAVVGGWCVVVCGGCWLLDGKARTYFRAMLPGLAGGGLLALAGVIPALRLMWNQSPDVVAEAGRIYVFERLPHHLALLALPRDEMLDRFVCHGLLLLMLALLQLAAKMFSQVSAGNARSLPAVASGVPYNSIAIIGRFAWGAVLLAAIGLAIELVFWNNLTAAARLLRFYWFRLTDVAVPLAVAIYAVWLISLGMSRRRAWAVWGLVAALVLCGWHIFTVVRHRFEYPVPPADWREPDLAAWVDACQWIAANTPPDALFLTPRRAVSFKWRAERPEVVTYKDIPQDAPSIVEWHRRLKNIHYPDGATDPIDSLGQLGAARIRELAREYGFDYVLSDRNHPLDLPVVYPNSANPNPVYVIYFVNDESVERGR